MQSYRVSRTLIAAAIAIFAGGIPAARGGRDSAHIDGFTRSPWYAEQEREERSAEGIRAIWNVPADFSIERPTRLIVYATPNGNTIEQTLGSAMTTATNWHFDIQHIAAQTRKLRTLYPHENIVLLCTSAEGLSWPAWRAKHAGNASLIRASIEGAARRLPGRRPCIELAGHSGGGSFLIGFLNAFDVLPGSVRRITFLDANYSYDSAAHHGDKLKTWLAGGPERHLVTIAYDDRNITLNGKAVVGPTGGTYRATHRMLSDFGSTGPLVPEVNGELERYRTPDRRALFVIHRNSANKILHTALVGDMNGFLMAMTDGTPEANGWGAFGGPRAYSDWLQPPAEVGGAAAGNGPAPADPGATASQAGTTSPSLPPRRPDAPSGSELISRIVSLPLEERESTVAEQLLQGNMPPFMRNFRPIRVTATDRSGRRHEAVFEAAVDYLCVGSDSDFFRCPLTPMTARRIAEAFGCVLPTRKMVDAIYAQAEVKLAPQPLTVEREAVTTFAQHNAIIEGQRNGKPVGLLVAGIKKDVVQTPALVKRPGHVAIYGWHTLDGRPIQPLTTVHIERYVDYSHGIRLIRRALVADGRSTTIDAALADPDLRDLLSDE